jgi:hypothetical protein
MLKAVFPLPLTDGERVAALTYPWEATVAGTHRNLLPPFARHQIRAILTRHVLIESAQHHLAKTLGHVRSEMRKHLRHVFRHISTTLEDIADAL